MKQVQKLSDSDIIKVGFSFDKYILWKYLKSIINDLISSKIAEIPTPTLQQVTDAGKETSNEIIVQAVAADTVTVTEGVQFETSLLTDIGIAGAEAVVQDSAVIITIDGIRYKIASQIEP